LTKRDSVDLDAKLDANPYAELLLELELAIELDVELDVELALKSYVELAIGRIVYCLLPNPAILPIS
jgi:hypothetical protein